MPKNQSCVINLGQNQPIHPPKVVQKQQNPADIMDVNPAFTHETVQRFHTPLLIHGHTHRENIHRNADYTRIVLGDWRDNYASILEVNAEGYRFIAL